jgi:hypothetical protein
VSRTLGIGGIKDRFEFLGPQVCRVDLEDPEAGGRGLCGKASGVMRPAKAIDRWSSCLRSKA